MKKTQCFDHISMVPRDAYMELASFGVVRTIPTELGNVFLQLCKWTIHAFYSYASGPYMHVSTYLLASLANYICTCENCIMQVT